MLSRYMPVEMRLKSSVAAWLKWLLVAGLYLLTAKLALNYFSVVDDNEVSREILAEMLRYFHLEVCVAADGLSALQLLQASTEQAFDLVLMDWRMNDHITKPVEPTRLFACLSKWLPPAGADARQNSLTKTQPPASQNTYAAELLGLTGLQALQRLLRENKLTEAEAYCHSLKGVTGNLGAHLLYQCISGIDNQLKQQQTPSTEQLNRLNVLLQQVMLDIDSLAAAPTSIPAATEPLSKNAVIAKVTLLLEVLETDLDAAETIINQLRAGLAGSALANDVNEIADQMEVFNIDQAMSLLSDLQQRLLAGVNSINHHEHD